MLCLVGIKTPTTKKTKNTKKPKNIIAIPVVQVEAAKILTMRKEIFLNNTIHKQNLTHFFSEHLDKEAITVIHATDDADALIAMTAIRFAKETKAVVFAKDTDILALLWDRCKQNYFPVIF